ncbi:helix-turn-helix domain-containing protein (plasmid) [Streptomyces sp. BI20]|uniref:helix-turn-helix domain-containing protein n=1 Tax=Streptomyces sp. BI20 TaxID=3403460 RepID=UPI003C775951
MSIAFYGFAPARLHAARAAAGVSVAVLARAVGATDRAISYYLAGTRTPHPEVLLRLAGAVGVEPEALCEVEAETLVHLRTWTGRSRAKMASVLAMGEETYRQLEKTAARGRLAGPRYDFAADRWVPWEEWAPPLFGVTAERLAAAETHTRALYQAARERCWAAFRAADPARAAAIEEAGRAARALLGR